MCQNGEILIDLGCTILVLVPNINTNTRGIVLLEKMWKVVEAIIDTRLNASISFHGVLRGFRVDGGKGAAILEIKISQELARVDQEPILLVFLDLQKA